MYACMHVWMDECMYVCMYMYVYDVLSVPIHAVMLPSDGTPG